MFQVYDIYALAVLCVIMGVAILYLITNITLGVSPRKSTLFLFIAVILGLVFFLALKSKIENQRQGFNPSYAWVFFYFTKPSPQSLF
ncbi:MAG: hypothetical protein G01um101420_656 [Parcubacteria group bacterium Gr01-1014_20]|nr:MAG: hypothetical protein G01um101420_656 [Parcubacteria group bacterium Gr01-1014_20]